MPLSKRRFLIAALVLLASGLIINNIWQTLPPSVVMIETGPVGGSYHDSAQRYARKLEAAGFKTEIRANPQSMQIIDNLEKASPRVDIGFSVQSLDRVAYSNVASAGVVELQPLFIVYNIGLGKVHSLVNLRGKRLVMPPEKSATAVIAREVLKLYDITEKNTRFVYLPIAQATEELKNGLHDAGFFMLAPANQIIRSLLSEDHLFLLSLSESVGISRQLDYLKTSVLHLGSYDLIKGVPDADVAVVGGLVDVMVRKDINPAVMYALLEAMKDTHAGQSLVSAKGEFPSTVGTALEPHPLAAEWAKSGTPWVFNKLSPGLASLIDKFWIYALAIFLLSQAYSILRYLYDLMTLSATSTALRILRMVHRRLSAGQTLGRLDLKLVDLAESIIAHESQKEKAKALLEQIRPAIKRT